MAVFFSGLQIYSLCSSVEQMDARCYKEMGSRGAVVRTKAKVTDIWDFFSHGTRLFTHPCDLQRTVSVEGMPSLLVRWSLALRHKAIVGNKLQEVKED